VSRCCARDEGWPFGVALRGEASNHHMLRWLKTVVVSDVEKAPARCQVGTRKMSEPEPLWTCRYKSEVASKPWPCLGLLGAGPGRYPITGQAVPGMEAA